MEAPPAAAQAAPGTPEPAAATTPPPAPAPPPPPPVQLVAADNTPIEGAIPTLRIKAPRDGQLIKTDNVELTLDVKNWLLTPDGNHIHVIVDNDPYMAVRDTSKPIDLRALLQKEGRDLTEGTHVLRVFPGRGHHEAVKDAGAFGVVTFHYKKKTPEFKFDAKAPLLTFSRPKGCVDLGARALIDFFVSNAKLSAAEQRVHYSVDATISGDIVAWAPHYLENLPAGEHRLQLTLQDANGAPVAGPFNDTTRTFRVASDCKAPAAAPATTTTGTAPATAPAAAVPGALAPPATQPPAAAPTGHAH